MKQRDSAPAYAPEKMRQPTIIPDPIVIRSIIAARMLVTGTTRKLVQNAYGGPNASSYYVVTGIFVPTTRMNWE